MREGTRQGKREREKRASRGAGGPTGAPSQDPGVVTRAEGRRFRATEVSGPPAASLTPGPVTPSTFG